MYRQRSQRLGSAGQVEAYVNDLPEQRRGALISAGLINAVVTIPLYALVAARLAVVAGRTWRRRTGTSAGRSGPGRGDLAIGVVVAIHTLICRRIAAGLRREVARHAAATPSPELRPPPTGA
jgi:hypothetical protein